jgi:hypothetical protein
LLCTALCGWSSRTTIGGSAFAKRSQFSLFTPIRFPVLSLFQAELVPCFPRTGNFGWKCPDFLAYFQQKGHRRGALCRFSLYFSLFAGKSQGGTRAVRLRARARFNERDEATSGAVELKPICC